MFSACASCRRCLGAAYQTPPMLFAGNQFADFLVIGQNPGEIKKGDRSRLHWLSYFDLIGELPGEFWRAWYDWDFGTSPGADKLALLFGPDWLHTGKYLYTNAVRCRTKGNAMPSIEMVDNCRSFTTQLIYGRKAIIFFSSMAANQVLRKDSGKLRLGKITEHPKLGKLLLIPHYVRWRTADIETYQKLVKEITS